MTFQYRSSRLLSGALIASALSVAAITGCKSPDAAGNSAGNSATGTTDTAAVAPYPDDAQTLLIGHYASLTGSETTFGKSTDNGIKMAFEEINAKGDTLGKKFEVATEDDGSQTSLVPNAVLKLINEKKALLIMGEVASSRSIAAGKICQDANIPMISPTSTNPAVTEIGDYIFRTCYTDPYQGPVMSTFALKTLKAKKAAILTDQASAYSQGLTKFFGEDFEKNGGTIVARATYKPDDKDFRAQLTSIKQANPDVIYVPGYYTQIGNIAKQARSLGLKQPMMGGDGWDSPDLFKIGGDAVNGCYFANHYSAASKDPKVVKFVSAYKAKFGETPDALAAVAYDAGYIVADAVKRAGSTDRGKIRDALAKTNNFPGVTGTITIGADRNAKKPITIIKIENGEQKFVELVNPYK